METILLGTIAAAVLGLLAHAFFQPREVWDLDAGENVLGRLRRRKEQLLRAIKDLEFEYEAGNLSEEEFHRLRNDYKRLAIRTLREIDRIRRARIERLSQGGSIRPSTRREVEKMIASLKAGNAKTPAVKTQGRNP